MQLFRSSIPRALRRQAPRLFLSLAAFAGAASFVHCHTPRALIQADPDEREGLDAHDPAYADPAGEQDAGADEESGEPADASQQDEVAPESEPERIASEKPDGRGRPVTTVFTGYELVRETIQKDGIPTTRLTIRGDAQIRHDQILLRANRMVIEGGSYGRLEGQVRIYDRSSGTRIYAARAEYFRDEQRVELSGSPYLSATSQSTNAAREAGAEESTRTLVSCVKIRRDLAAGETVLEGDVRIHQQFWSIVGDRATFSDADNELVLEDNPLLFGDGQFFTGNRLVYDVAERSAVLDGRAVYASLQELGPAPQASANAVGSGPVSLWDYARSGGRAGRPQPGEGEQAEAAPSAAADKPAATASQESDGAEIESDGPQVVRSFLTSRRLEYVFPSEERTRTYVRGDVLLTRQGLRISTPLLTAYGRDFHTIHTEDGVEMLDLDQNMRVRAAVMDYSAEQQILRLEGRPQIEFLKASTLETDATLRGAVIERDFRDSSTLAWGAVEILRDTYRATGELATFHEAAGVIILEGDPGLEGGQNAIRSEKILFYPEKNRILLYNRIRGYLGTE